MYVCLLDLTKAFDTLKHDILFKKLADKIPPLFLRVVIFSYIHQKCAVKWSRDMSDIFTVTNGVRQGAVASPTFFNVYLDELFDILRKSGLGCTIDGFYYGFLGYADDGALLSPSRCALQQMLNICAAYFKEHGIKISTNIIVKKSKTKCLAFNIPKNTIPANIVLNGRPLPWAESYKHLGHFIHSDESMSHDLMAKRGEFIGKLHALRQEVGNQYPDVFMTLVSVYLSSLYGSNLWDLFSPSAERLYSTWNVTVKETFDLDVKTHKFISQNLSVKPHIRISLMKRFCKFYQKLKLSNKPEVRHLFQIQKGDMRSIFGRNCFNLCAEMDVSEINDIQLNKISMPIIQDQDKWKIPFLKELLCMRDGCLDAGLSDNEIDDLICNICYG